MEKPFPGSYPREQEEADNEHSPARATGSTFLLSLLWRLSDAAFADRARGQWKCDTASSGGPEGNGHVDIASIPPREGTDTSVTPPLLQRPTAMATSTFPGCRAVSDTPAKRVSAYYDLLVCDFDGARNRDGNPRVAVRTRWAETQGHPATAPGTGTARTEAMH